MGDFEVVRETTIAAPRERLHALIDDAWEGNRKAGKGAMEIVSSTPEQVEVRLRFEQPWKATNQVSFELAPSGDEATGVTWRMRGTTKGFAALFSKVVSMDRMVGKDFEKGLTRMKAAAESGAAAPPRLDG
jgi:hypothetical protein